MAAQSSAPLRHGRLQLATGDAVSGVLTELAPGRLTVVGEQTHAVPLRDVVRFDFSDRQPQLADDSPLVLLGNGDLLAARVVEGDQERLKLQWTRLSVLPEFDVPLESVRAVILKRPAGVEAARALWQKLYEYKAEHDEVVLQNGDGLTGEVTRIGADSLTLGDAGAGTIAREGVQAVAFNAGLVELPSLEGPGALVTLVDGSRFRSGPPKLVRGELLSFQPLSGGELVVPATAVCRLQFLGERATLLADLEPDEAEFSPYLSIDWPWRKDRNCLSQPMRLRGIEQASGIGVHSRQRLVYSLEGAYRELRGVVGIDDSAEGRGAVVFSILLDGRTAWSSPVVRGGDEALEVSGVDLKGVQTLELVVEFGPQGDVLDHADWCDVVLVK